MKGYDSELKPSNFMSGRRVSFDMSLRRLSTGFKGDGPLHQGCNCRGTDPNLSQNAPEMLSPVLDAAPCFTCKGSLSSAAIAVRHAECAIGCWKVHRKIKTMGSQIEDTIA
jgi:hypothetical protein